MQIMSKFSSGGPLNQKDWNSDHLLVNDNVIYSLCYNILI